MADIIPFLIQGLGSVGGSSADIMVNLLQWVNNNKQATQMVSSVLASAGLPGMITRSGEVLVGFAVWTTKMLALFLVAIAVYFMVSYGIQVSGPMRERMTQSLMKFDVDQLWHWVRTAVMKMINTATNMVRSVKDKGVARSLKHELSKLYKNAKSLVQRRDVNLTPSYGIDVDSAGTSDIGYDPTNEAII